ncbi:MAG: TetR/AcrR family transcriptional regulator [Alphaproteobacteria bacterium]|nr:TetR/AcrR family transcriptional regulator [Alphaproteobacteria bacterium]
MEKDDIQNLLINVGRQIVRDKGTDALTVRKLSEASGCSVGAIYNQFSNMDNFIVIQNYITLDELSQKLEKVEPSANPYVDMNRFLQVFINYVEENRNLWFLLYEFHLRRNERAYSYFYLRKVAKIIGCISSLLQRMLPDMESPERILSSQVLWLNLFAVSSLLTKEIPNSSAKTNCRNLCQIVLNTYIAGLSVLERKKNAN